MCVLRLNFRLQIKPCITKRKVAQNDSLAFALQKLVFYSAIHRLSHGKRYAFANKAARHRHKPHIILVVRMILNGREGMKKTSVTLRLSAMQRYTPGV